MITEDISNYIPQRHPFIMVDELVFADDTISETIFTVRDGHTFVDSGYFTEPGLVENMAQTAAAGTGYKNVQSGGVPTLGFIGALKSLSIAKLPAVGQTIKTRITLQHQVMNALIAKGQVFLGDDEIASCEYKIFLQSNS